MGNRGSGFTIIELVIVLMVGSILTSIALVGFSGVGGRYSVSGAERSFLSLHARARAQAVEFGETVQLNVDPAWDSVWVSRGSDVLEAMNFKVEFNVDVSTSNSSDLTLCMNPRGFADTGCNSFTSPVTVSFALATDTASVRVLPLGQAVVD